MPVVQMREVEDLFEYVATGMGKDGIEEIRMMKREDQPHGKLLIRSRLTIELQHHDYGQGTYEH